MWKCLVLSALPFALGAVAHGGHDTNLPGYAPEVYDSPPGLGYVAWFTSSDPEDIQGRVFAIADPIGRGSIYHVLLNNVPGNGPFSYHVHEFPVPENGNCSAVGGHFNPFNRTAGFPCATQAPESCEVGDLSGKYGVGTAAELSSKSFIDLYSSANPNSVAFVGNRSIVIHDAAGERVGCSSFERTPFAKDATCVEFEELG